MRVLCLHGAGSSAIICQTQLRPFLRAADSTYEFVFVDGPVISPRGPGVSADIDGPFFSHIAGHSPTNMADAFNHLEDTIDKLGPFDGVLGFSQGAALAIAYIHRQEELQELVPFGFALCLSSVLAGSANTTYLQGVIDRLRKHRELFAEGSLALDPSFSSEECMFIDFLTRTIIPAKKKGAMLPDIDLDHYKDGDTFNAPRPMHPQLLRERVHIPTVHITGRRDSDFMLNMSEVVLGLCDENMVRKLQHSGGHHPPQKDTEVQAFIRAMEWAMRESRKVQGLHL